MARVLGEHDEASTTACCTTRETLDLTEIRLEIGARRELRDGDREA
jgi:hypothetical protein